MDGQTGGGTWGWTNELMVELVDELVDGSLDELAIGRMNVVNYETGFVCKYFDYGVLRGGVHR